MFSNLTVCRNLRNLHHMAQSYFSNALVFVEGMTLNCEQIRTLILEEINVPLPEWSVVGTGVSGLACTPSSLGIYRKRTNFSVLASGVACWEVSFVCRAYVGPLVQKDLQILIEFYVQLWSHVLWLVLHHFFELCLLSNQWLTSYTDHWTQEDGGLK